MFIKLSNNNWINTDSIVDVSEKIPGLLEFAAGGRLIRLGQEDSETLLKFMQENQWKPSKDEWLQTIEQAAPEIKDETIPEEISEAQTIITPKHPARRSYK